MVKYTHRKIFTEIKRENKKNVVDTVETPEKS